MKYVELNSGPVNDARFCYAEGVTDDDGASFQIEGAKPAKGRYPVDPFSVKVNLHPDFTGIKLPDLIGNGCDLLMLRNGVVDVLAAELQFDDFERLPFTLINHKGRVHSRDYVFFNPFPARDIAHPSSSFERYARGGEIYSCEKWILDGSKLCGLPDIVRPRELPGNYFVSQRFVDLVRAHGFTNFEFGPVECVGRSAT